MGLATTKSYRDLFQKLQAAGKSTNKSVIGLLFDALRYRYGETGLAFNEYLGYSLYDAGKVKPEHVDTYMGFSVAEKVWEGLNPKENWVWVSDKIAP